MPSSNTTYTSTPPIPDYVMQIHDAVNAANPSSPGDADDLHHELYTASQQRAESLVSDLEDAISQLLTERDALQYEVDELIIEHEELAEDFDELQEYAEDCLDEVEDLQDALDDLQDEHLGLRGLCGRLLDGFWVARGVVGELECELGLTRIQAANERESVKALQSALAKARGRACWLLMLAFGCFLLALYLRL